MRKGFVAWACVCFSVLGACVWLPSLQEATGGIPARDVVLRIKCELSDAFVAEDRSWLLEQSKFNWLKSWVAQVDLTFQVLDTATLSPGGSITQPLPNAYDKSIGPSTLGGTSYPAISQNLMVAVGANLNGQAQRTETLSFALSLVELEKWRASPSAKEGCPVSDGMDLKGRLGLKEWIREALSPVAKENENVPEFLFAGYHPKPNAPGSAPTASTPNTTNHTPQGAAGPCDPNKYDDNMTQASDIISRASDNLIEANKVAQTADSEAKRARAKLTKFENAKKTFNEFEKSNRNYAGVLDPSIEATVNLIRQKFTESDDLYKAVVNDFKDGQGYYENFTKAAARAAIQIPIAQTFIQRANKADSNSACLALDQTYAALNSSDEAKVAAENASATAESSNKDMKALEDAYASEIEKAVGTLKTVEPPIANIGQSVQFILVYGGNITPTWTFVRFKGPNNPLFMAQGTRTHMLNITLGPVQTGTTKMPTQAVTNNQLYLLLNNLLPTVAR
jgi:hypothetical protein